MAVRYTGDAINEPQLTLTHRTNEIVSGNTVMGRYTTLLKWHFSDPVSATEQARNDAVSTYQANRNPAKPTSLSRKHRAPPPSI